MPAFLVSSTLAGSAALGASVGTAAVSGLGGLATVAALLGWFACLARGRMPRGLRDATTYAIGYGAQTTAYALLLTDRYPDATPGRVEPPPELPPHPVAIHARDDLGRPRLLVAFRLLLAIPHLVWLTLWAVLAALAAVVAWLLALVLGRVPRFLHRFLAAFVRTSTHVWAFLCVVGRPFPGFVGREGSYPIDLTIAPPAPQRRLGVLARLLLAVPALLLLTAYTTVLSVVAMLGWAFALVTGRMPGGLRDLGVASLRYHGQVLGYLALRDVPVSRLVPGPRALALRAGRAVTAGAARVSLYAALGVAWVAAAWLLAGSVVPDDLSLPRVDVDAVFGKALVDRAERYERFLYVDWALAQVVLLATLAVYAKRGVRYVRESAAGPIGTGMFLGMVGLAIVWLAQLPFSVAALWWDRRHGVSEVGYLEHVFGGWLALGGTFVAVCVALLVVMALARWLGSWWWIPGAGVFALIAAVFVFVGPYLTPGLEPSHDARLNRTYARFERAQGVEGIPLRVEKVSGDTSQANAYAFGMGPSSRIVLWDTLLDGRFTNREVDVVLAHELAHHSSDHIPKAIAWFGLFALPGALVLMLATRRRGGMGEPAAVPLALLVVAVFQLVAAPAQNLVSRGMESEADWKALSTTHDPAAARGLFREFAATSLGDPSPPTWAYLMLQTHPTLAQRVAMANAWAARDRSG